MTLPTRMTLLSKHRELALLIGLESKCAWSKQDPPSTAPGTLMRFLAPKPRSTSFTGFCRAISSNPCPCDLGCLLLLSPVPGSCFHFLTARDVLIGREGEFRSGFPQSSAVILSKSGWTVRLFAPGQIPAPGNLRLPRPIGGPIGPIISVCYSVTFPPSWRQNNSEFPATIDPT
jgi:hypothetical protein